VYLLVAVGLLDLAAVIHQVGLPVLLLLAADPVHLQTQVKYSLKKITEISVTR
jgi:hypothetical protein